MRQQRSDTMDENGKKNGFLGDFTRGIRRYYQMNAVIEIGRWDEKGVGGEMEAKPKGKDVMGWGKGGSSGGERICQETSRKVCAFHLHFR